MYYLLVVLVIILLIAYCYKCNSCSKQTEYLTPITPASTTSASSIATPVVPTPPSVPQPDEGKLHTSIQTQLTNRLNNKVAVATIMSLIVSYGCYLNDVIIKLLIALGTIQANQTALQNIWYGCVPSLILTNSMTVPAIQAIETTEETTRLAKLTQALQSYKLNSGEIQTYVNLAKQYKCLKGTICLRKLVKANLITLANSISFWNQYYITTKKCT